ncbi:serine hydrolase-domain-containing protein [Aspergillus welwitschiae]|uniref:Serine hydrolase-domain-containing protein n=1 Tax=Aspergillus welwitschiae TaxID=1341132 RepID=A0A3F3PNU9_9EURO|nr:serine hydrolase-domain-containing protein [Aspergillus welwitschiae]RDH28523.1 serine hydrolase-domain-containing protein [Aspergillus welwitschiae]
MKLSIKPELHKVAHTSDARASNLRYPSTYLQINHSLFITAIMSSTIPKLNKSYHNIHHPRILCLHGGGTNAKIMKIQCRALRAKLEASFRLVYVEGPFVTHAGPGISAVYNKWAPFRNWMPGAIEPDESSPGVASYSGSSKVDARIIASIDQAIQSAMDEDDRAGGTGPWVGFLGFSRGAQTAASLLLRQQEQQKRGFASTNFRFALLIAAPAPLINMNTSSEFQIQSNDQLNIPTVHVYGSRDSMLRDFTHVLHDCCTPSSTQRYDWDADHQIPLKTIDVDAIIQMVMQVARETGAIEDI